MNTETLIKEFEGIVHRPADKSEIALINWVAVRCQSPMIQSN